MADHFDYRVLGQGIVITTLAYWIAVVFYSLVPILFPAHAAQYKLQPAAKPMPARKHIRQILLTLFNQVAVAFVFVAIGGERLYFFGGRLSLHFPTWPLILLHFLLYAITFEVMFYAIHRLLHTPLLYHWVHAFHHRFRAPLPYSGACVHPVEFVLAYIVPNLTAAALFNFSFPEYLLFLSLEYIHNVHDHCGYHYPWDPFAYLFSQNSQVHDEHHRLYRVNYSGAFTMALDHLFGTYKAPPEHVPMDLPNAPPATG
jgi:sterol desaturase/sphingolipid hydroxylase (fatty acid hydroxylase superfamily)